MLIFRVWCRRVKFKWIVVLISSVFLCSCSSTEYYYTLKENKKFTHAGLYSSAQLRIHLYVYDTKKSTVNIHFKNDANKKPQSFEVLEYKHFLIDGDKKYSLLLIDTRDSVNTPTGEMVQMNSEYKFEGKNPNKLIESIFLKLSIQGRTITISESINLKKASYGRLAEIWGI